MDIVDLVFTVAIIMLSVIIHEVMHGYVADRLGDPTARYAGRLTLNPIPHIDLFGSIIFPLISGFSGFFFGWAKPVPYNPYNFQRLRYWGEALVAAAGPLSNLTIAIIFGLLVRLNVNPDLNVFFLTIVAINCSLTILNLIPIPPLDGSKVLSAILPGKLGTMYDTIRSNLEHNMLLGFGLIIIFIIAFGPQYGALVFALASFISGV